MRLNEVKNVKISTSSLSSTEDSTQVATILSLGIKALK
jgi:hypothetical protein